MRTPLNVKMVGCGGIGLCVLNVLPRYLNYNKNFDTEITLIDGDTFEERNKTRQSFTTKGNKAETTATDLRKQFPALRIWNMPHYIKEDNVLLLIREGDVVFSCVDNHATRKLLSDRCEELENVLLISGGNEITDGNIQVHLRKNGENLTMPIANRYHPEIMNPTDKNPSEIKHAGCGEQQESEPQLVIANNFIAALMLNAFLGWEKGVLEGNTKYDVVYADCLVNKSKPVRRVP